MRVIVTGGAGFIGSAVCRNLVRQTGWSVLNLDKLTYASSLASTAELNDESNYQFVRGDICDRTLLNALFADFQPEAVINLAAESHVDRSIDSSAPFVQTNVVGTHTLLEAALAYWTSLETRENFRFLHVSTDEVYGSIRSGRFDEDSRYDPRSPYSASKAAADHFVRAWHHTYGLPTLTSHSSNTYGPYQYPEKVIPLFILSALNGQLLPLYGDGLHVRDWVHVDDHAAALRVILQRGSVGHAYNIGADAERRNLDLAFAICDLVDELAPETGAGSRRDLIKLVPDRLGHDRRYAIDSMKLRADLGWRPSQTFELGLRQTVEWYIARQGWWKPLTGSVAGRGVGSLGD